MKPFLFIFFQEMLIIVITIKILNISGYYNMHPSRYILLFFYFDIYICKWSHNIVFLGNVHNIGLCLKLYETHSNIIV